VQRPTASGDDHSPLWRSQRPVGLDPCRFTVLDTAPSNVVNQKPCETSLLDTRGRTAGDSLRGARALTTRGPWLKKTRSTVPTCPFLTWRETATSRTTRRIQKRSFPRLNSCARRRARPTRS